MQIVIRVASPWHIGCYLFLPKEAFLQKDYAEKATVLRKGVYYGYI
jgi:hypothetical protein